ADVVVVNHHLLLADFAIKEEGFGELLPAADACIIDEAHQLPDVASQFFGVAVSTRQLRNLVRDTQAELLDNGHSEAQWRIAPDELSAAIDATTLQWARQPGRQLWPDNKAAAETISLLQQRLGELADMLAGLEGTSAGLDQCHERTRELAARLTQFDPGNEDGDAGLRWLDGYRRGFSLHLTPFDVAERLGELMSQLPATWILTSATLAVGDDFSHFIARLGITDAQCLKLDSPFNFERNSLLMLPNNMPAPNDPGYIDAVCEQALAAIELAGGGAFVLFTSHRALREAAQRFAPGGAFALDYPVLAQGSAPRAQLLEQFRNAGNAVLLGTSSFWEGVDVRGTALRLVVIDKLPFASPGDPLMQARLEAIRRAGQNPFSTYQLPQAVLTLKQGVGRLIRDRNDFGVAMLCDPRLKSKSYGRVFLSSLPPMPVTDDLDAVARFYMDAIPGQQVML
ncbi:MAG: ATP-dependent DNA helicase, partial [Gammaproteobacteria bacterium]|nr:ATP-dependent DNA helicase [Gammaproteobacteria bacterium]